MYTDDTKIYHSLVRNKIVTPSVDIQEYLNAIFCAYSQYFALYFNSSKSVVFVALG